MSLSSLARSPESEQLLKFVLDHEVLDNWEHPPLLCYVNGRVLSGTVPVGELQSQELVVNIEYRHGEGKCSIHLSTLLSLATAYIKYQYEAVAAALSRQGKPVDWVLKDKAEGIDGRVMVYADLVAKFGLNSSEAAEHYRTHAPDNAFVEAAAQVRLQTRVLQIISEEQEAKIQQQRRNSTDQFLDETGFKPEEEL